MEDTLYPLLNLYKKLPSAVQDALGRCYRTVPPRVRFGGFYGEYCRRISQFLDAGPEAVRALQIPLVRETVNRAVSSVPFFADYPRIEALEEIKDFPVISKKDIVDNPDRFVSREFNSARLKANTGGSSGSPMEFYLHAGRTRPKESAHFNWFWGQYGYTPGARMLMIRGAPLKNNALCEYQAIKNCLAVSCYELNSKNINNVLKKIRKFKPQFIHGYPSAIKNFVHCIHKNCDALWDIPVKALFLGSEGLLTPDRNFIEAFFNAKIATWYGHSECAVFGGNSPESNEFFFFPFYGYTELLDESGAPVQNPGQVGRIVATSFDNFVMPFIRYDTGDLGVLSEKNSYKGMPCLVLNRIEGRTQDFIYLSDATRVSLTAFIFGQHLPQFARIREMQLEQNKPGFLTLRIAKGNEFCEKDQRELAKLLRDSVSNKLEIDFDYVDRIEKTHRGKHRFLIQNIENG